MARHGLAAALLLAALPGGVVAQASRCSGDDHRAFDFWVGSWEVTTPAGAVAGHNDIRSAMGGCVLHESYDGQQGYHGESFNAFDPARGVWHQTWVDNGGTLLLLEGGVRGGAMVMEGDGTAPDGSAVLNRITWSVVDGAGDRVRQLWQTSPDGGATWAVAFDGLYTRTKGQPRS